MQPLSITPSSTTINTISTYTIVMNRAFDPSGFATAWQTELVPAGSNLTIRFPAGYNTSYGYTCTVNDLAKTCTPSGQNVTFEGLFPTAQALESVTIVISNVLNPSPAYVTDEFLGYVGNDFTLAGDGLASVTLTPASFQTCSVTFNPSTVNKTGAMTINVTPQNSIPSTGTVVVSFPSLGYWFNDISSTPFPVTSSMTCSNTTANVNQLISCTGATSTFGSTTASRQVTASFLFSTSMLSNFGFQISNIISPPTNYSTRDLISIYSVSNGNIIDSCVVVVSGLQPNNVTMTIGTNPPTTPLVVNRNVSLRFSINLVDTINSLDNFIFVFPTGSRIFTPTFAGPMTFTSASLSGTSVSVSQSTSPLRTFASGYILNITMSTFTAPPSTQTSSPILMYINRDGATKMVGSATIQAVMSSLNYTVTPDSNLVNQNTTYVFNVTISDAILPTGRIKI